MITLYAQKVKENKACASKLTIRFIITSFEFTSVGKTGFTRSVVYCLPPSMKHENDDILVKLSLKRYSCSMVSFTDISSPDKIVNFPQGRNSATLQFLEAHA